MSDQVKVDKFTLGQTRRTTPRERFDKARAEFDKEISKPLNSTRAQDVAFQKAVIAGLKNIDAWLEQIYMEIPNEE